MCLQSITRRVTSSQSNTHYELHDVDPPSLGQIPNTYRLMILVRLCRDGRTLVPYWFAVDMASRDDSVKYQVRQDPEDVEDARCDVFDRRVRTIIMYGHYNLAIQRLRVLVPFFCHFGSCRFEFYSSMLSW